MHPLPTPQSLSRDHSHFREEPWRRESGWVPFFLRTEAEAAEGSDWRGTEAEAGLVSLNQAATRVSSAPPKQRRQQHCLPPLFLFLGLFRLCFLPVLGHFSRDSHVREAPDFVFIKFSLGGGSGRPPGSPRPRRPPGWGGGGGSKNSSRSPAEEPGGRRLTTREDPRGG